MAKRNDEVNPVALLSSHALMREGIRRCIDAQPGYRVVLCATNGDELLKAMERMAPRIVAVELWVPGTDACATMAQLSQRKDLLLLALCSGAHDAGVRGALNAGAHGFVCREGGEQSLQRALVELVRNGKYLDDLVSERFRTTPGVAEEILERMTDRQRELLQLICKPGDAPYPDIADHMDITLNTLHTHRRHLFELFKVDSRLGLVRRAQELGLHLG